MLPACSWNKPGNNPYRGNATEAVSRYIDIPAETRARLIAKIDAGAADDDVVITRDEILGREEYANGITDMHFGRQTICERVTRELWPATAREPAKVYCADGHCLIVPRICKNISRVYMTGGGGASGGSGNLGSEGGASDLPRPRGRIPLPDGAPEADIDGADAIAQLYSSAPPRIPLTIPWRPFGDWTPGMGAPFGEPENLLPIQPVPEPAGWLMLVIGAVGLGAWSRSRK